MQRFCCFFWTPTSGIALSFYLFLSRYSLQKMEGMRLLLFVLSVQFSIPGWFGLLAPSILFLLSLQSASGRLLTTHVVYDRDIPLLPKIILEHSF